VLRLGLWRELVANTARHPYFLEANMKPDLIELQASIENDIASSTESKRLAVPTKDNHFADSQVGVTMLKNQIGDAAAEVQVWFDSVNRGAGGKANAAGVLISDQDAFFVAYIAMKALMVVMHKPSMTLTRAAGLVSRSLQKELWLAKFKRHNRKLFDELMRDMSSRQNTKELKGKLVAWSANKDGFLPMDRWAAGLSIGIGMRLIDILIATTGWFELKTIINAKRQTHYLYRTKSFGLFAEYWMQTQVVQADYLPTVIPPKEWETWWGGGYHTDALAPLTLVKTFDTAFLKTTSDNGRVLTAINAMQNVGWRINQPVFDVLDQAFASRLPLAGMPMETENVFYNKATPDMCDDEKKERRIENIKKFEAVRAAEQQWLQLAQIRRIAAQYKEHEFWYPQTMDFRGRIYPTVPGLNPQGADVAKGLLVFSKGKPLTLDGWKWLMIHGANSWDNGLTKENFEDRVAFIKRNEKRILECAEAPLDYTYWSGAENPWQFLAFCFEYARLRQDPLADCVLPIGMDGTCNGLQHFSAMLRDPVGGSATNLVPSARPSDIYQRVADVVTSRLKDADSEIAKRWLEFGIDRKATKRQVMTLPYGSTRFSCYRYTREWFKETRAAGKASTFYSVEAEREAVKYLSAHIWEAIGEVVIAAKAAMDWLRECAEVVGANPIIWTAPSGFKVKQQYFDLKPRRIRTAMLGNIIRPRIVDTMDTVSVFQQRNGISPNFVHSFDAAHVKLTALSLLEQGITEFAFVHDNYLCLPTDAEAMSRTLREAFVSMHERPALSVLATELRAAGHDVPDPPAVGTLDLQQVLGSAFFFA